MAQPPNETGAQAQGVMEQNAFANFLDNTIRFYEEYNQQGRVIAYHGFNDSTIYRGMFFVYQGPVGSPTARYPPVNGGTFGDGWETIEPGVQDKVWPLTAIGSINPDDWNYNFGYHRVA